MTAPEAAELEAVDAALAGREVDPDHAALAELALLLRDERPEPTLEWATRLDRRVEARFPAKPRREKRHWQWLRVAAPALALVLVIAPIALIAALAPRGGDDGGDDSGTAMEASGGGESAGGATGGVAEQSADDGAGALAPDVARLGSGDPGSDARRRRRVERSASLILAAPRRSIDRVASRAGQVAADLGGFVASSTITSTDGGQLELRVPSERLDTAIQRLSRLGRVRSLTRESVDITAPVTSARDRLTDARAERVSLLRQLAAADTTNETESIRARLRIVSRQIAVAYASLRRVRNRANYANLSVALAATGASEEGAWTPGDAFDDALRVLEVAAGVAVIAIAVLLPLALAWLLAWLARRGVTRRRRERALDMA